MAEAVSRLVLPPPAPNANDQVGLPARVNLNEVEHGAPRQGLAGAVRADVVAIAQGGQERIQLRGL